jgi:hypothetical protein
MPTTATPVSTDWSREQRRELIEVAYWPRSKTRMLREILSQILRRRVFDRASASNPSPPTATSDFVKPYTISLWIDEVGKSAANRRVNNSTARCASPHRRSWRDSRSRGYDSIPTGSGTARGASGKTAYDNAVRSENPSKASAHNAAARRGAPLQPWHTYRATGPHAR